MHSDGACRRQALKRELERCLDRTAEVVTEPLLIGPAIQPEQPYYYRMRAVDDARRLGNSRGDRQGRWRAVGRRCDGMAGSKRSLN